MKDYSHLIKPYSVQNLMKDILNAVEKPCVICGILTTNERKAGDTLTPVCPYDGVQGDACMIEWHKRGYDQAGYESKASA